MKARLALTGIEAAWIIFIQDCTRENEGRYAYVLIFSDVQKAYETVWRDGLWC